MNSSLTASEVLPLSLSNGSLSESDVDVHVQNATSAAEIIDELVSMTLAPSPWSEPSTGVSALGGDLEAQFWPWNRAASAFLTLKKPHDALEIWSAMYLAFLSLQAKCLQRYHKGMALCNIGFALGKIQGRRVLQAKSWLLGIVEDVVTDPESAQEKLSFRNTLLMKGAGRPVLASLIASIQSRFVDQSVTPLFPETCIELWHDPTRSKPSAECMRLVQSLSERLERAYPKLPETTSYFELLQGAWSFLDWSKGVISAE